MKTHLLDHVVIGRASAGVESGMVLGIIARPPSVNGDELHVVRICFVSPRGVHVLGDVEHAAGRSSDRGKFAREKIANNVLGAVAVVHVDVNNGDSLHPVPVKRHSVRSGNGNIVDKTKAVTRLAGVAVEPGQRRVSAARQSDSHRPAHPQ
jgi:hypothetical protein